MGLRYKVLIAVLSFLIPLIVAILYVFPLFSIEHNQALVFLPKLNAIINASTTIVLLIAYWAIRLKKTKLHRGLMLSAFLLSALFLIVYVFYHATSEPTQYGGEGFLKLIYLIILLSHILLAALILPIVLITFYYALNGNHVKHKRLAKLTLPLWLYVTITGVLVYLMLSPYY